MKTKVFWTFIFALLLAIGLPLLAQAKEFKVGNVCAMSGPAAPWGIEQDNGLQMAAAKINANGGFTVNGEKYTVKIITYDTKYVPSKQISALNRLILKDNVHYAFSLGTAPSIAIIPTALKHKVALFCESGGGRKINNEKNYYVFNVMQGGPMSSVVLMPYLAKLGYKRLALINPNDETGKDGARYVKEVIEMLNLPIEIVAEEYHKRGIMDFNPVILRVLSKKPDWVDFTGGSAGDTGLALKQLRGLGYNGPTSTSMAYVRPDVIWNIAGEAGVGHVTHRFWAEPPTPRWAEMDKKYKAQFKEDLGPLAVEVHDVLLALIATISKEGTFDTTKIVDSLSKSTFDSAYGKNIRWGGREKIFGYGIDRQIIIPSPFSKVMKNGEAVLWYKGKPEFK